MIEEDCSRRRGGPAERLLIRWSVARALVPRDRCTGVAQVGRAASGGQLASFPALERERGRHPLSTGLSSWTPGLPGLAVGDHLAPWFSRCGLWTSCISFAWEIVRGANSWAPPQTSRGLGPTPSSNLSARFPSGSEACRYQGTTGSDRNSTDPGVRHACLSLLALRPSLGDLGLQLPVYRASAL